VNDLVISLLRQKFATGTVKEDAVFPHRHQLRTHKSPNVRSAALYHGTKLAHAANGRFVEATPQHELAR
jgi:hypothetical protein